MFLGENQFDHINRIRHDNQESNLRVATSSQNRANSGIRSDNSSGYIGVTKVRERYRAYIMINGKIDRLGYFNSDIEAALVRDKRAIELFGEYAELNFPGGY